MISIKPFPNQIYLKPDREKTILGPEEGIKCLYGQVMAVGDNVTDIKVGDTIAYEKWGIKTLIIKDEEFDFIHKDSDFLLCKLEMN